MCPRLQRLLPNFASGRYFSKMAEFLVSLPDIEKVSDRVIRVLGGNPSKVSAYLSRQSQMRIEA
jgi:hypothetical protein